MLKPKQTNQRNKPLNVGAKNQKNWSIIILKQIPLLEVIKLLHLFVIINISNNIMDSLLGFTQTCHYQMFYILLSFAHATPLYIFFLSGTGHMVQRTFPDLMFRVLLFRVSLLRLVIRLHKYYSRFTAPGFTVSDLVFRI